MTKKHLTGTSTTRDRVENDYYATPPESTLKLLEVEEFKGNVLEPCCGEGHISEVLKEKGFEVSSNDLVNRGYGEDHKDFLREGFRTYDNIITNPPYSGDNIQQIVEFCVKARKPWFLLLPNFVYMKDWFRVLYSKKMLGEIFV